MRARTKAGRQLVTRAQLRSAIKRGAKTDWRAFANLTTECNAAVGIESETCIPLYFPLLTSGSASGGGEPQLEDIKVRRVEGGIWVRDARPFDELAPFIFSCGSYRTEKDVTGTIDEYAPASSQWYERPWIHWEQHLVFPEQWATQNILRTVYGHTTAADPDGVCLAEGDFEPQSGFANVSQPCTTQAYIKEARPFFLAFSKFLKRGTRLKEKESIVLAMQWHDWTPSGGGGATPPLDIRGLGRVLVEH